MLPTSPERVYKKHQIDGIQWMMKRESESPAGGLLCDDMGLGKTEQTLGLIRNTPIVHTLLLCPKALIPQWTREFIRCGYATYVVQKGMWTCITKLTAKSKCVYLTNYESLTGKSHLFARTFGRVCLDEAHQYLCKKGKLFEKVASIKRSITWVITATPVVNSLNDTRNLLSLVGYTAKSLDTLDSLIPEAVIHRSMDELRHTLPNLPPAAKHTIVSLDFVSEEECEFYQGVQGKLVKRWRSLDRDNVTMRFQLLMKLRQLSIHPQVYIGARKREPFGYPRDCWTGSSTKFTAVEKLLDGRKEPTRWIIFCQFKDEMALIENALIDRYTVHQYHGDLNEEQKQRTLSDTELPLGGKHMVFLINIKSGGVGLNLQHFTHIIFMSPWWTSALMRQSVGRAVRIGQQEQVQVYHLVLKEEETLNIDAMMREKMEMKEGMLVDLLKEASRGEASRGEASREEALDIELEDISSDKEDASEYQLLA